MAAAEEMAWMIRPRSIPSGVPPQIPSRCYPLPSYRGRHLMDASGMYRVFNAAEYRIWVSATVPVEGTSPDYTGATLPQVIDGSGFADGAYYVSVSYYNGLVDSGFLPLGACGETYLRLDLDSGEELGNPPRAPIDWRLEVRSGGVVRIVGVYVETGSLRADSWAIAYTVNGSTPATSTPTITPAITTSGMAVLSYDLPAQSNGTTVKVRLQTRRNDGTTGSPVYRYSEGSTVLTATADASGPTVPLAGGATA